MRWLKRDIWKAGITIAGMLLLLVLTVWVPVSAAGAQESASGLATPVTGTVQATPAVNSTIATETANEQLRKLQRDNERSVSAWFWNSGAAILSSLFSTLVIVIGGLFGLWRWRVDRRDAQDKELKDHQAERERREEEQKRWLEDRQAERERRDEERFQAVVEGLGSEREEAKVGAAITLRTFLRPSYEQFYIQVFDLAVAHLRLPRTSHPSEDPDEIPHSPEDPNTPQPLNSLSQALITVFKESFPLACDRLKEENPQFNPQSLDASRIQLDNAYLNVADLKEVWMQEASLRKVDLTGTNLSGANLWRTNLSEAHLWWADLRGANLREANLHLANLREANLYNADLDWANLRGANLHLANLTKAKLYVANLRGANLYLANLTKANLSEVRDLENALSLEGTDLRGVKGLTKEQLERCKAKGAIIDEDTTTGTLQSPVSPPPPSQSNDAQAQSVTSAQGSPPTPDTDGSSTTSSKPSNNAQEQSATPAQGSTPASDTGGSNAASSSQQSPES